MADIPFAWEKHQDGSVSIIEEPEELREHIKTFFQNITKESVPPRPWDRWTLWAKKHYPHTNNNNCLKTMSNGKNVLKEWYKKVLDPPTWEESP